MKNRNLQIRFLKACLRLEERTGCHVFVERSPHVDGMTARVHAKQWKSGDDAEITVDAHYDRDEEIYGAGYGKESMLKAIAKINSLEDEVLKLQKDTVLQRQNKVKKLEAELAALKACD